MRSKNNKGNGKTKDQTQKSSGENFSTIKEKSLATYKDLFIKAKIFQVCYPLTFTMAGLVASRPGMSSTMLGSLVKLKVQMKKLQRLFTQC